MDFDVEVDRFIVSKDGTIRPADTLGKRAIPRSDLPEQIQRLIEEKGLSISRLAKELGVSVTTVRRICRTHHLSVYQKSLHGRRSRSLQAPFGWDVVLGELIPNPEEQNWISQMKERFRAGESLHSIARFLTGERVRTKNGGRWHAKTISQILKNIESKQVL